MSDVTGDDVRTCSICGELYRGLSNSAAPVQYPNATFWDGRCCDACNAKHVIPARLGLHRADLRKRGCNGTWSGERAVTSRVTAACADSAGDPAAADAGGQK